MTENNINAPRDNGDKLSTGKWLRLRRRRQSELDTAHALQGTRLCICHVMTGSGETKTYSRRRKPSDASDLL